MLPALYRKLCYRTLSRAEHSRVTFSPFWQHCPDQLLPCPSSLRAVATWKATISLSLKQFALDQIKIPEGPRDSSQPSSPSGRSPAMQASQGAVLAQGALGS